MSSFKPFGTAINKRFTELSQYELFVAGKDTDELWATYIAAFPAGTNPVYKVNTEHECSCCRNFVKHVGNAVAIVDGEIQTIWDVPGLVTPYKEVAAAMNEYVLSKAIVSIFRRSEPLYGAEQTKQLLESGSVINWNHFYGTIANRHFTKEVDKLVGDVNTTIALFKRGLEELSIDAIQQVLDLIASKSIYRGEEHLPAIKAFGEHVVKYNKLKSKKQRTIYLFTHYEDSSARFRNTVIGTLVQDLSEGKDLEASVRSFEAKVAPANYKRTTALITPRMITAAMNTINELGLESALHRRYANIQDISVNNVLWVDNSVKAQMKDGVEGLLLSTVKTKGVPDSKIKAVEIAIDDFMKTVLPKATGISMLVKNQHLGNFVSLTAPIDLNVKPIFKWENNFGWSYDGDIADAIREKVKKAGGNVDGKLRFSLAWFNSDDLDLHVYNPNGSHIFFNSRRGQGGHLDVDANGIDGIRPDPVENVAYNEPVDGEYEVVVDQYHKRQNNDVGFVMQIAHGNQQVFELAYTNAVANAVAIGKFQVKNGAIVSSKINKELSLSSQSKEKWGVTTEQFVPVQTVTFSPNYWDDNATGNKHWFFILEGCKNPMPTRGIYNEFLSNQLGEHRKVFEVLGDKTKCPVTDQQLSGLGFSSTRGDTVMVSVQTGRSNQYYSLTF